MNDEVGPSGVDDSSPAGDDLSPGRTSVRCPRCDTPITLVASLGPATHQAAPCGCRVPGSILREGTDSAEER